MDQRDIETAFSGYTDDEVLLLSGEIADENFFRVFKHLYEFYEEEMRNAAASAAERVMSNWTGQTEYPLPHSLQLQMDAAALEASLNKLHELLGTDGPGRKRVADDVARMDFMETINHISGAHNTLREYIDAVMLSQSNETANQRT